MEEKAIDKKLIFKDTINMAWPSVAESVLVVLAGMVDTYMVAGLGKPSVAAVGLTNQPKYFIFSVFFAINIAISSLVARRVGEGKREDANTLFSAGFRYVLGVGALLSILCVVFAHPLMQFSGAKSDTIDISVRYFKIIMGCSLFNLISLYINAAQRGSGNTKIAMTTNITSNIVNVVMNYLLIGGHCGFPKLGVEGAAIATVIGTVVACIMSFRTILKEDSFICIKFILKNKLKITMEHIRTLSKIGSTILGELLLTRVGFMITAILTAKLGTVRYAAHQVGMNFMNLGFAFGDGLQVAAVALIGRSLGEKNPDKARAYASCGQKIGLKIALVISAIMLVFGKPIFGLYFPHDEKMLEYGFLISCFIAVIMPIQISKIVFNGTLRGAGDVKYTLYTSTVSVTIIQPIVTQVLLINFKLGLVGVWVSILTSQAALFILFYLRFRKGKWAEVKI